MNDMTPSQEEALFNAMRQAGEFLHECGTTDLAALTPEQALEFGKIIVCRYGEADWVPF